jgi:Tfp pilus assembly protein PilF
LKGAEACLIQLLENRDRPHFASVDTGLAGYKARHNLAVVLCDQGRPMEAEAQWREALSERPDYVPSLVALANHFLKVGRHKEVTQLAQRLESTPARAEAQRLRACVEI